MRLSIVLVNIGISVLFSMTHADSVDDDSSERPEPSWYNISGLLHTYGSMFATPQDQGYARCRPRGNNFVCTGKAVSPSNNYQPQAASPSDGGGCCPCTRKPQPLTAPFPVHGVIYYPVWGTDAWGNLYFQWAYDVQCQRAGVFTWKATNGWGWTYCMCERTLMEQHVVVAASRSSFLVTDLTVVPVTTPAYCTCKC